MTHILVLARSEEFRQSLIFALDAEGYLTTAHASFDDVSVQPGATDCTILDHHAIGSDIARAADFVTRFAPVVLLANTATHPISALSFRTVTKPFLGPYLSQAVARAVRARMSDT